MLKTLIVEDDFVSRRILQRQLTKFGECDVAINGLEALNAFKESVQSGSPYSLICLDIQMPELDGLELLEIIRKIESENGIDPVKVIVTTSTKDPKTVLSSFKLGCEGFVAKPFDVGILLREISKLGVNYSQSNPV